jgi:MFS family permease
MNPRREGPQASQTTRTSRGAFRSLGGFNYRLWAAGALVSNIGTWMQRIAQDWLVFTVLTHRSATSVGLITALQLGPQVLLLPWTGAAADRFDRRKILFVTQSAMAVLAAALGLLTLSGHVALWHVDLFAFALGCVTAFDAPARQAFVSELVAEDDLANAVALNSATFNAARMLGPAAAGALIAAAGTASCFLVNAASFVAVLGALASLRVHELHRETSRHRARGGFVEGLRYVRRRPDLVVLLSMLALIGTFGLNFPVFIAVMSVGVFHHSAGNFGISTSVMAIGSITGALLAARAHRPRTTRIVAAAAAFGVGCVLAAVAPNEYFFDAALVLVGISAQTFTTTTNGSVQLSTAATMRGRVLAILMAIALGGAPIGAPLVGWVADALGPRWSLVVGASAGFVAAAIGFAYLASSSARDRDAPISVDHPVA